ncbi:hypothetical protein GDO86_020225 [Hymenochirus boettgeri]|uniref:TIL domain-containing protein n=1 Tax=Hymenochirus boettgeri TaxID=247094 RepID=A0A8T2IMJ7_9PIPI|nr:hypothetical protein GDO86_020225 [Hymenochirus boettgeri]
MLRMSAVLLICAVALNLRFTEANGCPSGQEFSRCAGHCPLTCDNYKERYVHCAPICVPGCICRKPHVFLSHRSRTCVLPRQCH